ncbi:hypothetical protein [Ruegeria arenilitoris]|uniref:hypothetical protein n=1 Tax=Ruegeria arenilitoris TaxID=1173585 RepID=UPI00147D534C|nr:hypothetical protein [Ruegeria arenilitoris]
MAAGFSWTEAALDAVFALAAGLAAARPPVARGFAGGFVRTRGLGCGLAIVPASVTVTSAAFALGTTGFAGLAVATGLTAFLAAGLARFGAGVGAEAASCRALIGAIGISKAE